MRAILVTACLLGASVARAQTAEPSPSPSPSPSPEDEALLKEIEAATAAPKPAIVSGSRGLTTSNVYNPAMSVNGLFLGWQSTEEHEEVIPPPAEHEHEIEEGFAVQEVEVRFLTNVDPYFAADLILAMHGVEGIELEEAIITPSFQAGGLGFRLGKMKLPFGRENTLHTHALPFVDRSLAATAILGGEGLNEVGIEASWLTPLPWYALLSVAAVNGDNDELFASELREDIAGVVALKNVFDLTSDLTFEVGASGAAGKNVDRFVTNVAGAHAVFKWRPARSARTRSAVLAGEAYYAHVPRRLPGLTVADDIGGAYGYAQVQVAQRWHVGGRFDYLGFPAADSGIARRGSAIVVFAPSEFSAIRFQGSATKHGDEDDPEYAGYVQLNFTLGAHPAHAY